jgi:hypothetical protein
MSNPRDENRPPKRPANGERRAKEQDLHATEDSIRVDLARLTSVEDSKTTLDPGDPMVDRLSAEAVEIADGISRKTRAERQLGQDLD